jgi:hypothetical protein
MADEWTDENTKILTKILTKFTQERMGSRPNTYLTPGAFEEVAIQFKNRIGLEVIHPLFSFQSGVFQNFMITSSSKEDHANLPFYFSRKIMPTFLSCSP